MKISDIIILIGICLFIAIIWFRDEIKPYFNEYKEADSIVILKINKEELKKEDNKLEKIIILKEDSIIYRNKYIYPHENSIIASFSSSTTDSIFAINIREDYKRYGKYLSDTFTE